MNPSFENSDHTAWFDRVYARNKHHGDPIPWARMRPNPNFLSWLEAHPLDGNGKTALVTGCGLGDDAEVLAGLGFAVTAFDISETAVQMAQDRWQSTTVQYEVADLFALPTTYQQAFDFVLDAYTIQSLPLSVRQTTLECVARTVAVGGQVLVIALGREEQITHPDGPPWALSLTELAHFNSLGLHTVAIEKYQDHSDPRHSQGVLRWRAVYQRVSSE